MTNWEFNNTINIFKTNMHSNNILSNLKLNSPQGLNHKDFPKIILKTSNLQKNLFNFNNKFNKLEMKSKRKLKNFLNKINNLR